MANRRICSRKYIAQTLAAFSVRNVEDQQSKNTLIFPFSLLFKNMEANEMKSTIRILSLLSVFLVLAETAQSQAASPADINIVRSGITLRGKFYIAEGSGSFPTLLILQGFPGNPSDVLGLGKAVSQSGINVMTFNFGGLHQSEGSFSLGNCQLDISAAFDFLHQPENITRFKIDTSLIILGGYSFGGGMGMTYAIRHPLIKSVIDIAGNDWGVFFENYSQNPEMKKTTDANISKVVEAGIARLGEGGTPAKIVEAGIDKLDPSFFLRRNAGLLAPKNILLICGWDDDVTYDYIIPLYRELKKENALTVQIASFQDDHSFMKTRAEIAEAIVRWIKETATRKTL